MDSSGQQHALWKQDWFLTLKLCGQLHPQLQQSGRMVGCWICARLREVTELAEEEEGGHC